MSQRSKIFLLDNADSKNSIDQRHGGNSDPRDRELVMKHVLPSLVDLATAVVERTRSDCSSIVRDQAYHEYEAYANENREAFIQKLMEEAWPHALQRMRTRSQRWYERKMYVQFGVFRFLSVQSPE